VGTGGFHQGMDRYARFVLAALAIGMTGFDFFGQAFLGPAPPVMVLACSGDFGQFSNGFLVARPSELNFIVDWRVPSVYPVNGGSATQILSVNSAELSFVVQYEGYRAAYWINRLDGTISQRPNIGGVYFGRCDPRPYEQKF
jgi:hypothetical protein